MRRRQYNNCSRRVRHHIDFTRLYKPLPHHHRHSGTSGVARVVRCAFEASVRVTNGIPLGCPRRVSQT
jgi:hypothetical protein